MTRTTTLTDAAQRVAGTRWPRLTWRVGAVSVAALVALFPLFTANLYYQNLVILALVTAVGATGVNMISGYSGYTSLGHGAFLGLGGYAAAIMSQHLHVTPFAWVPFAGVVAAIFAAILGVIAMRARGAAFAIITLALGSLMLLVAQNWTGLTKGNGGLYFPLPAWSNRIQNWPFHFVLVAILGLALGASAFVRRTRFGLGLMSIRDDEPKAETIGVNTRAYKILGFVLSAFFIGMAGAVYGYYVSSIVPVAAFSVLVSVQFVIAMLLGGAGTLWGPVLGAFMVEIVDEVANNDLGGGNIRLLVYGALLVLVVLLLPSGVIPTVSASLRRLRDRGRTAEVGTRLAPVGALPLFVSATEKPNLDERAAAILEVRDVSKHFGGLRVLRGCSFAVPRGSITGLIGPNGSGKTTAFNIIDGSMPGDAGDVYLDGKKMTAWQPWTRAHSGLARTFQITRVFRNLTVQDNLLAPVRATSMSSLLSSAASGKEVERARRLLEFVGLERYAQTTAGAMSYGQQKLVELAQVLMMEPEIILLDEPCAGINPTLIERLGEMIRQLNQFGITFLIVEHNMPFVLSTCGHVVVLGNGSVMANGTPDEIKNDPAVLDAYLGHDYDNQAAREEATC
jgi:ABC-type branched-subunit amino acid transport system ATPase component/ABC-type branched-subunit amino acid transport system permease subunit